MTDEQNLYPSLGLEISDREFNAFRDIMYERTGVYLKSTKKPLVVSRLRKRLVALGLERFSAYIDVLKMPNSPELETFVNAITTNETFFFRHTKQFNILYEETLPGIVQKKQAAGKDTVTVWSAACSTGEEPYSLAITCHEFLKTHPGFKVKILASDINSSVINEAKEGLYTDRSFRGVPDSIKQKYFTHLEKGERYRRLFSQINPDIKKYVEFSQHNLLHMFPHRDIDVIFLRNVLIYFDLLSKETVVKNLEQNLTKGGYLFTSLSESLNDVETHLQFIRYGIYQKI